VPPAERWIDTSHSATYNPKPVVGQSYGTVVRNCAGWGKKGRQHSANPIVKGIMNLTRSAFVTLTFLLLGALPAMAQQKRLSPHETVSAVVDGNRVTIVYGRPYSKSARTGEVRKIWGTLVPYGKVWRTGADEATLLITQKPIVIGETTVPAGAYTLFTLPSEDGKAQLIISKQLGQWGLQYDEKQDFARVDLKKDAVDPTVDQFTMSVAKNQGGGGIIKLTWENTQFSVPFTLKK
jgi:hypothetical protein